MQTTYFITFIVFVLSSDVCTLVQAFRTLTNYKSKCYTGTYKLWGQSTSVLAAFHSCLLQNKFMVAGSKYRNVSQVLFSLIIFQLYIFTWALRYCWKKHAFLRYYNLDLNGLLACHVDMYDNSTNNSDFIFFSAVSHK